MKKSVSSVLALSLIMSNFSPTLSVFANEVQSNEITQEKRNEESQVGKATVSAFTLNKYSNFNAYNEQYRVPQEEIISYSNNGGRYGSSTLDKAFDGNLSTHWETGKANSSSFTNEVVVEFNSPQAINRIAYATRQDSAKGKGFPTEFEIYASASGEEDDFQLAAVGSHTATGNMMQFQFDTITAKKMKFVFKSAHQNWASASEFWFYKEDKTLEQMGSLFTNESKNELSADFNTIEKLNEFEVNAQQHPLYEMIQEDIANARILLESKKAIYMDAIVSTFSPFNDESLVDYDAVYKVPSEKITSITANGGHYASEKITRAIDNDFTTNWHSGTKNSETFTNEVVITLDELTTINRIMYSLNRSRGFAEEFEVYVSKTSQGDTFELVTAGQLSVDTKNTKEILFNPTEARRIKFVFKKGLDNWAIISEIGLYKPDNLSDIMQRLFVDDTMSEVNPDFANISTIESLMEEAKNHPFADKYLEKLKDAKELVEFGIIEVGTSNVTTFKPFYTDFLEQYDTLFRVPITSISGNGGYYSGAPLAYAIDDDMTTHWETGKSNSDTFTNEVILTLEQVTEIERLTYKARTNKKGFPTRFSIYVSPVASGDNFQKVAEGTHSVTDAMLEIQFDKTKAKRVKFVFDEANQNRPSIGDIRVYAADEVANQMKNLFANKLMDTLTEEYNSVEALTVLENKVLSHPLASLYLEDIQVAKAIINNEVQTVKTIVAEQHGDRVAHANQNLKFGFGNNNQPTGVLAKPGDTVVVYVDAEPGAPLPQLLFSQQEGSFANWGRSVSLQVGKNIITVPEVPQTDKWYRYNVTPGGPVYIVNPYTEEQQGKAPVVRFAEGVELFPMMDKDTDEQEFLTLLKDYKKRVDLDKEANPDVMDRQMIDVVEVVSNHIVFTGTATGAYEAYINQGFSPMKTVEMYNDHLEFIFNYLGIDGSELIHDAKYIRDNIRLAQPYAAMYAAGNHIGVQNNAMVSLLTSVGTWGIDHEIGHRLDISVRTVSEVTNNMIPQNSAYYYDIPNRRIPFETRVYKNVIATDNNVYVSDDHFEDLAVFWQLEMIYPGYWGKLNRLYRENNVVLDSNNSAADKLNQLAKYSSLALQLDLTEHFERHGFFVSDETKEIVSQYQKPAIKTWYANYDYIEYDGNGFEGETHLVVTRSTNGEHNQLDFNINDQAMDDVLGYEIFKGDQLIGFTSTNSFVDTTTNVGEVVEYTVVPYDKKLNPGQGVSISSLAPTIMTSQETVTVKLNESFNPMQLVKAYTYNNEEITNAVTVDKEIDTTQKGIIPLTFIVENQGITVTKTINVEVVSDYDYLSDKEWTAVETDFGTPRRNTNIKGRVNGEIQTFDKGFGIHANGRITYDLTDLEYDRFEALIGVDMTIAAQNNSSLQAKIIVDGQTLATTPVLKHADNMVLVNVPIKGAKQLVIEINDGRNANTSDHAIIVNPKLTTNNAKPELTVTDRSYQLSEVVDLTEGVMAIDAEDGDLTSQVQIISNNYEANKTGRFEVTYQVMDSDGNKVTKTRRIFVYSTETALTDLEWISAVSGWKTVNKDLAVNKTNKIQLKVDGEVQTFDRGIGAATNAEIVYDLNGEYSHFTTYVGTDKNYDDNRASIIFKIYADGEEVYTSNLIKHDSDAEFVSLNVEGVHELKLVADDSGNGGLGDFASWGNPRLYHTNVKPELMVEEDVTLKLGASLETIIGTYQATDVEDGDLTSQVVVDHSNLNLSKAGTYQITYTVTDSDNNTVSKTRTINLYNKEIALTDLEWISAVSGWKTVNKDLAVNKTNKIQLKVDGEVQTFDRGIGAATNAEIVYQLNGEYSYFTTYVGTDKNYDDNRTSIIFKIYADGEEVYTSNLIKRDSDAEFVSLNVEGVHELKLVADDSGNGGLGDFASWGDPRLYQTNVKPELMVEEDAKFKLGTSLETIIGTYQATDVEDGELTSQVVVDHSNLELSKAGTYQITYTVTDSDNNTVSKTRTIVLYNKETALTDLEWISAVSGWKTVNKDLAVNKTNKIQLKVDGIIKKQL